MHDQVAASRWLTHFQHNDLVHRQVDALLGFNERCELAEDVRAPLIASVRRFQLGESGDGVHLLAKAAASGDAEYLSAMSMFVAEEQQHADLLLRLLGYLGARPMQRHWTDSAFIGLRRLLGLRTEVMVLTVAEVIALSYYGALAADCPDPVVRAVAERILDDEHAHVRFQAESLRTGSVDTSRLTRAVAISAWWVVAVGTTVVVAADHGRLLRALGHRRTTFARNVFRDFAGVVATALP